MKTAAARASGQSGPILEDETFWTTRAAELEEWAREEREAQAVKVEALRERRLAAIPPVYREVFDTGRSKLAPEVVRACLRWSLEEKKGIGLSGATGKGKTRILCSILCRLKCSWLYLPAGKLSQAVSEQWDESPAVSGPAVRLLREARRVKVLMLDDLGDEKHTEAVTVELKELVEHRTSRGLHLLWTSNLSPRQITAKHGERGAAIVRRLADFTWSPDLGGFAAG